MPSKIATLTIAAVAALLLTAGPSAAVTFTVAGVDIDTSGESSGLTWSASAAQEVVTTIDTVGDVSTITYGWFSTLDFPLDLRDQIDEDSIDVSFFVSPPEPPNLVGGGAEVDGRAFLLFFAQHVVVDFANSWTSYAFDDGGFYSIRFHDLTVSSDGTYALTADIRLDALAVAPPPPPDSGDREPGPGGVVTSVPEPGAVVLAGLALLGLEAGGRRRRG